MDPEVAQEIDILVRSGFYDRDRIIEIITTEMYEPGELETGVVASEVDSASERLEKEQAGWPKETDCDRLDTAFAALSARGVVALQNAGYTQSDGYDDFRQVYASSPDQNSIVGYCYFHGQDLERAVVGGGLYLSLGPAIPRNEEVEGPRVGEIVREELEEVGLGVDWDGTFGKRLYLPEFVWQRRTEVPYPTFSEAMRKFRNLLLSQGWSQDLRWIRPVGTVFKNRHGFFLEDQIVSVDEIERLYSGAEAGQLGILLKGVGQGTDCSYCSAWRPESEKDIRGMMMPNGLKLAVMVNPPTLSEVGRLKYKVLRWTGAMRMENFP